MNHSIKINSKISDQFKQKGSLLLQKGGSYKFRALAYFRAAKAIDQLDKGLDEIYARSWLKGLEKIKGIGNRLAHEIENELKESEKK